MPSVSLSRQQRLQDLARALPIWLGQAIEHGFALVVSNNRALAVMHCMSPAMPLTLHDGPCACSQDNSELKRSICTGDKCCEWSYQYLAGGGQGHVYSNLYRNSALKLAPVTSYECVSA